MTSHEGPRPSPEQARQALESVSASKQALAAHVRSPVWLYPLQGLGMGLFVIGVVFAKDSSWASGFIAAAGVLFCVLPMLQTRGRLVTSVYTHPGSRGPAWLYVAAFAFITVAAVVLYSAFRLAWIGYGAAVLVLVLTLLAGPAIDARLARALRTGN